MISCARVYWNCLFNSWISHPGLSFISFQMKFNYPVPSHFQFSGQDGSGTEILSDPVGSAVGSEKICESSTSKRPKITTTKKSHKEAVLGTFSDHRGHDCENIALHLMAVIKLI